MPTVDELIQIFRKETEDLLTSKEQYHWNIHKWETTISEGETKTFNITNAFDSASDYHIIIHEALDSDGVNIIDALEINPISSSQFSIYSPRACSIKVNVQRKTPKFELFTA